MTPEDRKTAEARVEVALTQFYERLDNLTPSGVDSFEWLALVGNQIGDGGTLDGYEEWINDTWEPLEVSS